MAEDEIELAGDENGEAGGKPAANPIVKIAIIAIAGLLVLGGSVTATLYLTGEEPPQDTAASTAANNDGEAEVVQTEDAAPKGEAIYMPLDPPFTVSLDGDESRKYLQVSMSLMSRSDGAIDAVRRHRPLVRNNLNLLFSGLKYRDITTREGKEQLLEDARQEINKVLEQNGEKSEVEALYFTSLVID